MTTIVWTALITASATLIGSLGGVWITSRHDDHAQARQAAENRATARQDRQREAYGELVMTARLALRNFRQLGLAFAAKAPDIPAVNEALSQTASLAADMNKAAALAELVGSPSGRKHARAIYGKAKACADLFQSHQLILGVLPESSFGKVIAPALPGGMKKWIPFDAATADARYEDLSTAIDRFIDVVNTELAELQRLADVAGLH